MDTCVLGVSCLNLTKKKKKNNCACFESVGVLRHTVFLEVSMLVRMKVMQPTTGVLAQWPKPMYLITRSRVRFPFSAFNVCTQSKGVMHPIYEAKAKQITLTHKKTPKKAYTFDTIQSKAYIKGEKQVVYE